MANKSAKNAREIIKNDLGDAMGPITDLNQDISASYTEAEVQAISDKVDEILAELRAAGLLAS